MSENQEKASKPQFSCSNPCNQFLIQHLLKWRQKQAHSKLMKNRHRNNDHQFHIYTRAIDSIKKYPLPIICEDQLSILAGIGDCLSKKLLVAIKDHYRLFLKGVGPQQKQISKAKSQEKMYAKGGESLRSINWMSQCSSVKSIQSQNPSQNEELDSQNRDKMAQFPLSSRFQSDLDSRSVKSSNLQKKSLNYKPRQGTQAANVLKILNILNAQAKSVTKKDIDKCLLQNNYEKLKQWKSCKQNLIKSGYIQADPSVDYESYFLTAKGEAFAAAHQQQQSSNITKQKMQSEINAFKQAYLQKQKDQQQASISRALSLQSSQCSQSHNFSSNISKPEFLQFRKPLELKPGQKLTILIDTREMKDQGERAYFQQTLVQKYQIDVITHSLTIGDFVFCYDGYILDFVIERKKADDLAASIIDGRYRQQKLRLTNCGASNLIYLYEGHPSQNSVIKQKQLQKALFTTRVSQGFKVIKTSKTNETVKMLASLYSQLTAKIQNQPQSVFTIGTIQQFNRRNAKSKYLTVESIFGLSLKTFPNVGKQTVVNILRYFKSFYLLYLQLEKYQNNAERVQFMNGLLKGGRTQAGVTKLIVDFLFGNQGEDRSICSNNFIEDAKEPSIQKSQSQ